jgi:hypothetical protein
MGHHKIAAAIFVGSLIVGSALVLSAELIKPARYEYHTLPEPNAYLLFDKDSGQATVARTDSKTPAAAFDH